MIHNKKCDLPFVCPLSSSFWDSSAPLSNFNCPRPLSDQLFVVMKTIITRTLILHIHTNDLNMITFQSSVIHPFVLLFPKKLSGLGWLNRFPSYDSEVQIYKTLCADIMTNQKGEKILVHILLRTSQNMLVSPCQWINIKVFIIIGRKELGCVLNIEFQMMNVSGIHCNTWLIFESIPSVKLDIPISYPHCQSCMTDCRKNESTKTYESMV